MMHQSGAALPSAMGWRNPPDRLASPWHTDADLRRPIEVVTDMGKSRCLGFTAYHATHDAFLDLFTRLRADCLDP